MIEPEHVHPSFILFTRTDGYEAPVILDDDGISACQNKMDRLLPMLSNKAFMISRDIEYSNLVMILWWALVRKVSVVIEDIDKHSHPKNM